MDDLGQLLQKEIQRITHKDQVCIVGDLDSVLEISTCQGSGGWQAALEIRLDQPLSRLYEEQDTHLT